MNRLAVVLLLALITGCKSSPEGEGGAEGGGGTASIASAAAPGRIDLTGPAGGAGYSFAQKRQVALESMDLADLLLYFDANDCANGAIFGHTDKAKIHVLGKKTWDEVKAVTALPTTPHVTQVVPTADLVGAALLMEQRDGTWAAVRITEVTPSTHAAISGGGRAAVAFEWAPFRPQ